MVASVYRELTVGFVCQHVNCSRPPWEILGNSKWMTFRIDHKILRAIHFCVYDQPLWCRFWPVSNGANFQTSNDNSFCISSHNEAAVLAEVTLASDIERMVKSLSATHLDSPVWAGYELAELVQISTLMLGTT